jgi:adenylylsulfate kinase
MKLIARESPVVWLTGLSGAGKSTLAAGLYRRLVDGGRAVVVLDGDVLRAGLCQGLGFSPEDRRENIRRVAEVAKLMREAGLVVICALISPLQTDRALARSIVGIDGFIEVHVATPLEACEARDPKGLYQKARAGLIPEFTGVSAVYETPAAPALVIDTSQQAVDFCVARLLEMVDNWSESKACTTEFESGFSRMS